MRDPGTFTTLGLFEGPQGFPSREVRAFVPPGLMPGPATPTLYVFDGQNAFSDPSAPHGGWRLDAALGSLDPAVHTLPLVVSIPSSPQRMTELCPFRDAEGWGGGGEALLNWLLGTVAPRVQQAFGVRPGPLNTALAGASMGGLLSLYGHLQYPGEFGGALCLSPSLWPADFAPLRVLPALRTPAISRIYLDCGGVEAEGRMIALVEKMAAHLATRGYPPSQLKYVADSGADHLESEWARRLPGALGFFYRSEN